MKVEIGPYTDNDSPRKINVQIDNYDLYSADHTLALIIQPLLKKFKVITHGFPIVDDWDVPDGMSLRSTEAEPRKGWESDDNAESRWEWVLDEMIYAFDQIIKDNFEDNSRVNNGLRLFGKYYRALWD